jgi:hypothetical protein
LGISFEGARPVIGSLSALVAAGSPDDEGLALSPGGAVWAKINDEAIPPRTSDRRKEVRFMEEFLAAGGARLFVIVRRKARECQGKLEHLS